MTDNRHLNERGNAAMPRFFFHIEGAINVRDERGMVCHDASLALRWAKSVAANLAGRAVPASVVVCRPDGAVVGRIDAASIDVATMEPTTA